MAKPAPNICVTDTKVERITPVGLYACTNFVQFCAHLGSRMAAKRRLADGTLKERREQGRCTALNLLKLQSKIEMGFSSN